MLILKMINNHKGTLKCKISATLQISLFRRQIYIKYKVLYKKHQKHGRIDSNFLIDAEHVQIVEINKVYQYHHKLLGIHNMEIIGIWHITGAEDRWKRPSR